MRTPGSRGKLSAGGWWTLGARQEDSSDSPTINRMITNALKDRQPLRAHALELSGRPAFRAAGKGEVGPVEGVEVQPRPSLPLDPEPRQPRYRNDRQLTLELATHRGGIGDPACAARPEPVVEAAH